MKKFILVALGLAGLIIGQFFVPIEQDSGSIEKASSDGSTTCEQRISSYRYSLLLGDLSKYKELSKAFSDLHTDEPCGTERITIKLFLL